MEYHLLFLGGEIDIPFSIVQRIVQEFFGNGGVKLFNVKYDKIYIYIYIYTSEI